MNKKGLNQGHDRGFIEGGYSFFVISDQKDQSIGYHYHSFYKCLIVFSGEVVYTVEDQGYSLRAGDILWVPSFEAHRVEISGKTSYRRCVVYLSEAFLRMVDPSLAGRIKKMCQVSGHLLKPSDHERERLLSLVPHKPAGMGVSKSLQVLSDFLQFIEASLSLDVRIDKGANGRPMPEDRAVAMAITYIKEHSGEPVTIEAIANHCYLSRHYLMHHFKELVGMTLYQYLTRERLSNARTLMGKGMTLTEIAYGAGFSNYPAFSRAFTKHYNMSPKKFMALEPVREDL